MNIKNDNCSRTFLNSMGVLLLVILPATSFSSEFFKTKEFKFPYKLNEELQHKGLGALFSITKMPIFIKITNNQNLPSNDEIKPFNNSPIQDDLKEDIELQNTKWNFLFRGPSHIVQKIGKFGVDLIGLGHLYGSGHFTGTNDYPYK